ncbi:MAG: AAA family ATPase, partial [Clostridiales bacterium]|nr:AAA family ATPase [Clostridiales bacterium]
MIKSLDYTALKRFSIEADLKSLPTPTAAADEAPGIIGQEKATNALNFGLKIKSDGYNIFISGAVGTGKTTFAKAFAEKTAQNEPPPPELCYIYNFKNPQMPKLLQFDSGLARVFKEDIEELINGLVQDFPKVFSDSDFEDQKNEIVKTYQDKRELIIKEITEEAKKNSFGVKMTNSGIYFMPIVNGEIISEEQYDALSDDLKDDITGKSEVIQLKALDVMHQINAFEKATQEEVNNLEYKTGLFSLGRHLSRLCEKYEDNKAVLDYLADVKEDILDSMSNFISEGSDEADSLQAILPWAGKKSKEDFLSKYMVNVITENGDNAHAPVITDYNPTVQNLIGEIEYDSEFGNFSTDYMKIKPGLLHKANGGYLILQVQDVVSNAHV